MLVAGDYTLGVYEGTEQYSKPLSLITHPLYNRSTNNADIMLIKVCSLATSLLSEWVYNYKRVELLDTVKWEKKIELNQICFVIDRFYNVDTVIELD